MAADVLIVDDEADIRALVAFALEGLGFTTREAADGVTALAELKERAPDLLVIDVMMPGMDGFSVLRTMRQQGLAPKCRTVVLSAKVEERDYLRGWELGCDDYISKPFEPDRLARRLQELLSAPAEQLHERRETELQKAELLDRLESAFSRPRGAARGGRPARL